MYYIIYTISNLFLYFIIKTITNVVFSLNRCQLPSEPENASYALLPNIVNMSYPFDYKLEAFSSCKMYDANFTEAYYSSDMTANQTINCHRWIYKETFQNTAVMEVKIC